MTFCDDVTGGQGGGEGGAAADLPALRGADIKTTSYLPVQMLPDSDDEEYSSDSSASEEARSPWSTPPSSPHYSGTVSPPLSPLSEAARQGILDIQLHSGY
eukprot:18737-Heterococcus_DN1.PRE.3